MPVVLALALLLILHDWIYLGGGLLTEEDVQIPFKEYWLFHPMSLHPSLQYFVERPFAEFMYTFLQRPLGRQVSGV